MAGNGAPLNFKILTFRLRHIETATHINSFADFAILEKLAAVDFIARSVRICARRRQGAEFIKFSGEIRLINFTKNELSGYNCVFCGRA